MRLFRPFGAAFLIALLLSSCARAPQPRMPHQSYQAPVPAPGTGARRDTAHVVAPLETLWRISRIYDVSMRDIMRANNLEAPRDLKMGQRLVIPGAAAARPVFPLYTSHKWKYIIIHHSVTEGGNAFSLYNLHKRRGFDGLGYDFIIDNGTATKADGQIEVSQRWVKQLDGAHCKAGGMNYRGIGVCLVGNFSRDEVSPRQMDALVYLVRTLKDYYHIPLSHILGHGQVHGARTECPGARFPWAEFRRRIAE